MTFLLLFNRIEYVGLCRHGRVKVDLIRKFLWSNSLLCCLEIGSSVHRLAVAARSIHKHFTDTPAIQFGIVGIANESQHGWHYLAEASAQVSRSDQSQQEYQEMFSPVSLSVK